MNFTYKPGYKIELAPRGTGGAILGVSAKVHDALDPSKMITIHRTMFVEDHDLTDINRIKLVVSMAVRDFEMHEIDEWLKHDGVLLRKPHP